MKFLKNNLKVIIAFILGLILAGGIVYAATSARNVTYTTANNGNIKNVEDALNDLYNKSNSLFNSDNISILANNNYDYTFTENYDYVLVSYLTDKWANTNYYVSGINNPISMLSSGNHWGLVQLVYSDVKVGNKIVLGGSATRSIIIAGINN